MDKTSDENGTIYTLKADIDLEDRTNFLKNSEKVIIDLNGYTISSEYVKYF